MKEHNTPIFVEDLRSLGIVLSEEQIGQFLQYYEIFGGMEQSDEPDCHNGV